MELDVIRACAAAASDATIGINAQLAALPLDAGDATPPQVTLYNSVDHGWVARQTAAESGSGITFPAVAILVAQPTTIDQVHTVTRDAHFPVAFAYVQRQADSAHGLRDALYTQRAILRFLTAFAAPTPTGQSYRFRNGVGLVLPESITAPPTNQPWGAALVTSAVIVTWLVRETSA